MKKRFFILPFVCLFAMSGCDYLDQFLNNEPNSEQNTTISVSSVNIVKPSLTLEEGESEVLEYIISPSNASNKGVSWSSSNEQVASVDSGLVSAHAKGESIITITTKDGGFTDSCKVIVTGKQEEVINVTGISIFGSDFPIEIGKSKTLSYQITPSNATNKNVIWSSDNESIATVVEGEVFAHDIGHTIIRAKTEDGNYRASCSVIVVEEGGTRVQSVTLSEHSIEVELGDNPKLSYSITPYYATNQSVTWFSSNEEVVTVDNGWINPKTPGEATITVVTDDGGFQDCCDVTVKGHINVTSVNISKSSLEIEIGANEVLQYTVYPLNATNKNVSWNSSNVSVATIENGIVEGLSKGQTTITVTTEDGNKTDTCLVNVIDSKPVEDDPDKNGQFYGGLVTGTDYTGYEFSKSKNEIIKPSSGYGEINVFSFNDFHGSIIKQNSSEGNETGIKQLGTFYKEKSQEPNTIILDQGDTWQGSFESNYTYGALIQDVFTYAGVTARTVGNHDFDWGLAHLEANSNRKYNDDYIPCLAANVYDYENGVNGDVQQSQLGKEYCTYTLDNGIKVGVIGVIGEDQITSISSQLVSTICFKNYVEKIKELSDFLRGEKDCDVIIASTHEGSSNAKYDGLTEISSTSGKRYVDLVLGGHQHYVQEYTVDGVKFVQWNSNGVNTGKVTLKYDFSTNKLVDDETVVDTYYAGYYDAYYSICDPTISTMVDEYLESVDEVANEVLSTKFSGEFDTGSLARLMTEAIYDRVSKTIPNIQFASCNYARTSFSGTTFTYRDLYKCFPFDNQIILMDVSSSRGINSLYGNYTYRGDTSLNPSSGNSYKCAIIDYVAVHQNSYREYDRFPDAANGYTVFNDTSFNPPTYREILYLYLKANQSKNFSASNYSSSNEHYIG